MTKSSGSSKTRFSGLLALISPSVLSLMIWMIVPLAMTLWFSFRRYNLLYPNRRGFAGFDNYRFLIEDPALLTSLINTLVLVGATLAITVILGILFALLFDQPFWGQSVARLLVIAPFFVMPTVSALIWKNLLMHPANGLFAYFSKLMGVGAIDWFGKFPMLAIIIIVAWQWTPFATLILLTAIQSLGQEQIEAARMDGAGPLMMFFAIILPHLQRAISVVVMIEAIFLLNQFAEIFVTTSGGPGLATTNLAWLIYLRGVLGSNVGSASAAGVIAIILANIVAIFLIRTVARNLEN